MLFCKQLTIAKEVIAIHLPTTNKKPQLSLKTSYYNECNRTFIKNNTTNHKNVFIFILLCITIIAL